jgi:hypothetical protein
VSSSAILNRDTMPKSVGRVVVKSEFIADHVRKIIGPTGALSVLSTKPRFSAAEMSAMGRFLLDHDAENRQATTVAVATAATAAPAADPGLDREQALALRQPATSVQQAGNATESRLRCKNCNESAALDGRYGKFGYYVKCRACGTNTSMKSPCSACGSREVRVNKSGGTYTATCSDCRLKSVVFQAS